MEIEHYEKALEIARKLQDQPREAIACICLEHAYIQYNQTQAAIEY